MWFARAFFPFWRVSPTRRLARAAGYALWRRTERELREAAIYMAPRPEPVAAPQRWISTETRRQHHNQSAFDRDLERRVAQRVARERARGTYDGPKPHSAALKANGGLRGSTATRRWNRGS